MTASEDLNEPARKATRHAAAFIFFTVCLDAMGIGIIMPVMPDLVRELSGLGLDGAALWGGYLSFSYAVMQFAFGPTIGNLSDRFGRRPILLVSLGMLTVDYLIMALAPSLMMLLVGRVLAGIAAATHSTANAYIADVSAPEDRAKNFGLIGAAFGVGFILGPVIGGIMGEYGARAPFYAAAGLAAVNFMYGLLVLPESLTPEKRRPFKLSRANPLGALRQVAKLPMVGWFLAAVFLFDIAHFVYPAVWSYFTREVFGWSSTQVGLSLAVVGVGFVVVQGFLIRFILPRLGEVKTVLLGFGVNIVGLVVLSFTTQGWIAYAMMPLTALGGIAMPALRALMTNQVPDDAQGELQGIMSSIMAIGLLISPVLMTQLFGYFSSPAAPVYFPGAPFLAAAVLIALAIIPFLTGLRRHGVGSNKESDANTSDSDSDSGTK